MKKNKEILLLITLYFFTCMGQGRAAVCFRNYYHAPNDLETVTGTVQSIGLNSIDIFDEEQKRVERFIDVNQSEPLHEGDYVRIYYHPRGAIVVRVKRMTVLEYKENGQNLGNIFHKAPA